MLKTISCGEVRAEHIGKTVTLAGWVHRRRDHGGLIFIDLRDREGIVQVVFNPDNAPEGVHSVAESLRNEWVVQVSGDVNARPEGTDNPNLPTGEIEVAAEQVKVLNESKTPPFYINEESEVDELIRMKYRFLDLRRESMRDIIIMRHEVVRFIRDFLSERGFLEVETPILIKSTPEGGARLPGAEPPLPRQVLRPAAVAAAAQAASDGCGRGEVFPDCPLLPRRRSTRRPPAGAHPARPRNELRRRGRRAQPHRGALHEDYRIAFPGQVDNAAVPAHDLCGGDGFLRER